MPLEKPEKMDSRELFLFSGGYVSFSFVYESEDPLVNLARL